MLQTREPSSEILLRRIDAIINELQSLRQAVLTAQNSSAPPTQSIVEELFGSLGPGDWDEYDLLLEWEQFAE
jgi:hypothetical protein